MRRNAIILSLIIMLMTLQLVSCNSRNELPVVEDQAPVQTQNSPTPTPESDTPSDYSSEESDDSKTAETKMKFSSLEEAYYNKYVELAGKYGTYSLCDFYRIKGTYDERSYLNGVCVVNLMDFNGDGIQDLFVVYSNGQMNKIISDSYNLEIYDFPTKDTYEFEIWTYKDEVLTQILHESFVSTVNKYPNNKSDSFKKYYRVFITVYENGNGFPVIQIYDENEEGRIYTNIYHSEGQIINDTLTYSGDVLEMNGSVISENIWSKNVAGFNKILLCSLLADSSSSSGDVFIGYNIDYNNTLLQTDRVIRYLSQEDKSPVMPMFNIAEDEYISLYLQEIERANRIRLGENFTENHYFALYDMDHNGVPELILYEGSTGAGTHYHFYTIINNEVVDCGEYGRTSLYVNGDGGLIAYFGRMNYYIIDKITLNGGTILIIEIAGGYVEEEYPELEEFGYDNYEFLTFCPPAIPFSLYTYNQELSVYYSE